MNNNDLFHVETLQNWSLADAAQQNVDDVINPGGACNSNSSNNSADEP